MKKVQWTFDSEAENKNAKMPVAFEARGKALASSSSAATALDDHAQWLFDGATDNLDAELLVLVAHYI